jgi:hypothetical protein
MRREMLNCKSKVIFLSKREGGSPTVLLLIIISFICTCKERKIKHHPRLCSHDSISSTSLDFALWITIVNSFLNISLQWLTDFIVKNSCISFLPYAPRHNYYNLHCKRHSSAILICLVALSGLNHPGTITPMSIQHCLAK